MMSPGRVGVRCVPYPLVIAFYGVGALAREDEGNGGGLKNAELKDVN